MKSFLKKSILAGILVLSCSGTVLAAPTAENVVNDLGTLGSFYTLYPDMPIADYEENWDGIAGWTKKTHVYDEYTRMDTYTRDYKIENKLVHERVSMQVFKKFNAVKRFQWQFASKDHTLIEKIYFQLYDKMAAQDPEIANKIPRKYIPLHGINNMGTHPFLYFNNKTASLVFEMVVDNHNPKDIEYVINMHYASEIWR